MNNLAPFFPVPRDVYTLSKDIDFQAIKPNQRFVPGFAAQIKLLCLLLFFIPSAWPQAVSGTAVIAGWNEKEIVVVTDSRSGNITKTYRDDDCKISALSNKFFIASSRIRKIDGTKNGLREVFDSHDVARQAFGRSRAPSANVVADEWAVMWAKILNSVKNREQLRDGSGVLFVGLNGNGQITVAARWVALDKEGVFRPFTPPSSSGIHQGIIFGVAGGMDIVNEFQDSKTPRAKNDIRQWQASMATKRTNDPYAEYVVQLMRWVIQYTTDSRIGGHPEAIELRPSGTVKWLQPCQAQ